MHRNLILESIGFHRDPQSITATNFLTSMTDQNKRWIKPGLEGRVLLTSLELETTFRKSTQSTALQAELGTYDEEFP